MIAKVTYNIEPGGRLQLSQDPEPISMDRASPMGRGELYYASDFVPVKEGVDVLVVGHAHAAQPTTSISVGVTLGEVALKLEAVSGAPRGKIPLDGEHVFSQGTAAHIGPRRVIPHTGKSPADYNAAPAEQRLSAFSPKAKMSTVGLLGDGAGVVLTMPSDEPSLFVGSTVGGTATHVPLSCDTIWLDVDRSLVVLVWRGTLPTPDLVSPKRAPYAVVMLGAAETPPAYAMLAKNPDLAAWTKVIEWSDFDRARKSASDFARVRQEEVEDFAATRTFEKDREPPPSEEATKLHTKASAVEDWATTSKIDTSDVAADLESWVKTNEISADKAVAEYQKWKSETMTAVASEFDSSDSTDSTESIAFADTVASSRPAALSDLEKHDMQREHGGETMVTPVEDLAKTKSKRPVVLPMLTYARLKVHLDAGGSAEVLRESGLTPDEWAAAELSWKQRASADPRVAPSAGPRHRGRPSWSPVAVRR